MEKLETELRKCETIGEMLDHVNERYSLHSLRPGLVQKLAIAHMLGKAVKALKLEDNE